MGDLIEKLRAATGPNRDLDAAIVAALNNAMVKPYPPHSGGDGGWQFWSMDGQHFLGNAHKFPVPLYTTSIDAALTLVPEGKRWCMFGPKYSVSVGAPSAFVEGVEMDFEGQGATVTIALCIAALLAREARCG